MTTTGTTGERVVRIEAKVDGLTQMLEDLSEKQGDADIWQRKHTEDHALAAIDAARRAGEQAGRASAQADAAKLQSEQTERRLKSLTLAVAVLALVNAVIVTMMRLQ